ncbi:MAG: cytochrome c biogenesis protein CcsA [Pirellulales bacterium]|nr:cytochrome c biogenesis protein CcsA [Pirellulales bacterium]
MESKRKIPVTGIGMLNVLAAVSMPAAIAAIFFLAPREETMGEVQRIFYVHVAVAWCGLMSLIVSALAGASYLFRRDLAWDHWSLAAAELGWLGCGLALITGSLWARAAWSVWWTWDPRLTTTFILWLIYSGYFLVRGGLEDGHRRARVGAVMTILGMLDLPLLFMATRWFRGIHPVPQGMEPSMRTALIASLASFSALFLLLLILRKVQLKQAQILLTCESAAEMNADDSPGW